MPRLNATLEDLEVYASKSISQMAKADPSILNLSIGEPEFGPPAYLLSAVAKHDLSMPNFLDAVNRYEESRGSPRLRQSIADWYWRRYRLKVDPETEILVTHGGVGAIALAVLSTTQTGDRVGLTDPSYMLYERSVLTLGRVPEVFERIPADQEYRTLAEADASFRDGMRGASALIVNSPENPSGYVLTWDEWCLLLDISRTNGVWLIHDEVYDTMAFDRAHHPAASICGLDEPVVLVNSLSKKFGTPGLRIGWLVANRRLIDIAAKAHDYLYLGVNIVNETVATRFLSDPEAEAWFAGNLTTLRQRAEYARRTLNGRRGFTWDRIPHGGMFLFPGVRELHAMLPARYRDGAGTIGEAVARYLAREQGVAVVPGTVYGAQGRDHLRMVLCTPGPVFQGAMDRLARIAAPTTA